jgi:Cdc6-like AAA superfamily ATPase
VPLSLPCREDEFATIYTNIESAIENEEGTCIYISGVPGTGKTATVSSVMRSLQERVDENDLAPFQLVELNGMKLTDPTQAYVKLWEAITGNKARLI